MEWCAKFCQWIPSILFSETTWIAVGSLATFVVAIVTYLTVREMKKSRQQTIRPNIIVLRPHEIYNFRWVPLEALQPVIRPQLHDNKPDQYGTRLPVFRLKNIGSGPAMHIQIKWNIEGKVSLPFLVHHVSRQS